MVELLLQNLQLNCESGPIIGYLCHITELKSVYTGRSCASGSADRGLLNWLLMYFFNFARQPDRLHLECENAVAIICLQRFLNEKRFQSILKLPQILKPSSTALQ